MCCSESCKQQLVLTVYVCEQVENVISLHYKFCKVYTRLKMFKYIKYICIYTARSVLRPTSCHEITVMVSAMSKRIQREVICNQMGVELLDEQYSKFAWRKHNTYMTKFYVGQSNLILERPLPEKFNFELLGLDESVKNKAQSS